MRSVRPKTGDKRKTRQPLKLDRAPELLRDRVMKERAAGRTWSEIEEMSPRFEEWEKTAPEIRVQFPGLKLPHSTLQRWHDLRVEQVKREMLADQTRAREIAALFAGNDFKKLPEAVRNAIGDQLFAMMQSGDDKSRDKVVDGLLALGELLNQQRKTEIREKVAAADLKRVELLEREFEMRKKKFDEETDKTARKAARGKAITTDDINRIRERTFGLPPVAGSPAA